MLAEWFARLGLDIWSAGTAAFAVTGAALERSLVAPERPAPSRPPHAAVPQRAVPPMPRHEHWDKIERTVRSSITAAETARTLHGEAGRQLDAVDYAYGRMIAELAEYLPAFKAARGQE
jgi:hypothetical protein